MDAARPLTSEPGESDWAELREAQRLTTQKLPNTGMAVITDVGEESDIHPKQKEQLDAKIAKLAKLLEIDGKGDKQARIALTHDKNVQRAEITLNYLDHDPAEAKALRARHAQLLGPPTPMRPGSAPNTPDLTRRLRIGYLSPDFRRHSVAYFVDSFLPHHDAAAVEVFCYSNGAHEDDTTAGSPSSPKVGRFG